MQQLNTGIEFQQIPQYRNRSYEELIMSGLSQFQAQIILKEIISEELLLEISKLCKHQDQEKVHDIINYLACLNIFTYEEFINKKFTDEQLNELDINLREYQKNKQIPITFDKTQFPILRAQKQNIFLDNTQCTILMLGQTGSGKSTFINMLSNFLLLETEESKYRVKLVYEDNLQQTLSQTDKLQNYVLYSRKFNKVVNLIDTPGFGDTRGIKEDERITDDLQKLLTNEINQIDMVCLVKKESDNRLDDVNKYVIGKIFELFGKDIVKNFQIILTHSQFYDEPKVINLFKDECDFNKIYDEIIDPKFLQFEIDNIGVLYSQKKIKKFSKNWKNWKNCQKLYDKICNLKPQCLLQTKQVLENRQQLLNQLDNLGMELNNNLNRMNLLQQHFQNMGQNSIQKFKEIYLKKIPIPQGSFITNCLICKVTCHYPCFIEQNSFKSKCYAMTNGICRVCSLKCSWEQHINNNYRYEYNEQKLEQVQRDSIFIVNEYQQLVSDFIKNQDQMIQIHQQICQTALLPKSHQYIIGYIEFSISKEKENKYNGYQERINELNKIKYKIEQLEKNHIKTLIAPLMDVINDNQLRITLQKVKSQISNQN